MQYLRFIPLFSLALVVTALPEPNATAAITAPARIEPPPPPCTSGTVYQVRHVASEPKLVGSESTVGSVTCSGNEPGGCTLTHGNSYSISVGYTVGGGLTLDLTEIFTSASLDASYTYSTTKGTINSGTVNCPHGKWTCGLKITPYGKEVSGKAWKEWTGDCTGGQPVGKHLDEHSYTVHYPHLTNNQPDVNIRVCTCPNLPHAKGAPPLCPKNC